MNEKKSAGINTIDGYLQTVSLEVRPVLQEIRRVVKTAVPDATDEISYRMPAFKRGRVFLYFAAFKNHIGVYPPVKGEKSLQEALRPYRNERGNLRFPLKQPIPYDLIRRVATTLAEEYGRA